MIAKIALALSVVQAVILGTLYLKYRKPLKPLMAMAGITKRESQQKVPNSRLFAAWQKGRIR